MYDMMISGNLLKVQDETGAAIEPMPLDMGWTDNIGAFDPGEGYKVRVATGDVITITQPSAGTGILNSTAITQKTVHFKTVWEGNGHDHMNVYLFVVEDNGIELQPGDEIGIFDGETCVGTGVISSTSERLYSLVVSADDPTTAETDGFETGSTMHFKLWRAGDNIEITVPAVEFYPGYSGIFIPMGTTVAVLQVEELSTGAPATSLGDNFPNPFAEETTILFTLSKDMPVELSVYNMVGQKVNTLVQANMTRGSYKLTWNGTNALNEKVVSGIYFLKMLAGDKILTKIIELAER